MSEPTNDQPVILDAYGKRMAMKRKDPRCPKCGAPERNRQKSGWGPDAHPVCSDCGHQFFGERWES